MKRYIFAAVAAIGVGVVVVSSASAVSNGILGTVCRNGIYFTVYPSYMAQPVGTSCPIRDNFGNVIGSGVVTNE
jgi:hypothetical protein